MTCPLLKSASLKFHQPTPTTHYLTERSTFRQPARQPQPQPHPHFATATSRQSSRLASSRLRAEHRISRSRIDSYSSPVVAGDTNSCVYSPPPNSRWAFAVDLHLRATVVEGEGELTASSVSILNPYQPEWRRKTIATLHISHLTFKTVPHRPRRPCRMLSNKVRVVVNNP